MFGEGSENAEGARPALSSYSIAGYAREGRGTVVESVRSVVRGSGLGHR
jgi:hypothetical protein